MKKRIACLLLTLVMLVSLIPAAAITASAASITVSEAGVRVIKEYMGFHRNAYETYQGSGKYVIGYGTPAVAGQTITEANADKLLREELQKCADTISSSITVNLVQRRMDALVWLSYVEGTGWISYPVLLSAINSNLGGSELVDAMCTFDYDTIGFTDDATRRATINHRMAMANLYLNGTYSASNTGAMGFTVFDAGQGATVGAAQKAVQAYVGSTATKINVPTPTYITSQGTIATFLGWYDGSTLVTGLSSATNGKVLTARWQLEDKETAVSYTLPAYVVYEANKIPDNGKVNIYGNADEMSAAVDVLNRDAVITVVAEKMVNGQKWLRLSTGGWVKLCNNLSEVPVTIPAVTVTITDDYVNIRQEPSVSAAKVGQLRRGDQRTIAMTSNDGKWGYCSEGWIFLAYTDYNGNSSSGSGKPNLGSGTPGTISGASLVNVRKAAGVYNALVTQLASGTAVTVYEQTSVNGAAWGRIDQGWVSMGYVTLSQTQQPGSSISTGASAVVSSSVSLNVRSGPGTGYTKVASLAPGTSVVILRKETVGGVAWGLIDQGWINLNYVSVTGSSSGSGSTGSTYGVGGTVVNCSTGVNIRSAAGTYNALVGVAALGSRVTVSELADVNGHSWGNIGRGWVCMDYIKLDSEFKAPSKGDEGDGLNNVVTTFEGYPAVTNEAVSVLETASAHANVLMTLNSNVEVSILAWSQTGDNLYGKVIVGGKTGWIDLSKVTIKAFNAKVTASKADVYELPSTRSKFYTSLVQGTYITIPEGNDNWNLSDNTLWGKISQSGYTGWIKLADVTMFKGNALPTGKTTLSGVGYLTGSVNVDTPVFKDDNGNVVMDTTAYTLTNGTRVNILARNYVNGTTYGKVTVGSVTGWILMNYVTLDAVPMRVNAEVKAYNSETQAALGSTDYAALIGVGNQFTVTRRILMTNSNEINHGIVDVGFGYLNDNPADTCFIVLDDGKLVPTGTATTDDPANPSVVSSVVVTGTANSYLSVYEEAVDGSQELLKISFGQNVTILNWKMVDGVTWGKVQINKIVGWVKVSEISFAGLKGVVAVEQLPVYSNADKASSVQILRVNNKAVDIASVSFDGTTVWGNVSVAGYSGWVDLANMTLNTPGWNSDNYKPSATIATGRINSVNATINLADAPGSTVAGDVTTLPKGTAVNLMEVKMADGKVWWRVDLGDKDGWIDMDCLTLNTAVATVRNASTPIYDDLTLAKQLYTLYRDEKATVLNFKYSGGALYGEVAYSTTTGWILICDAANAMNVSLVPGSTNSSIGGGNSGNNGGATTPTTPTTEPTAAYIVCASTVNVRSGAGVFNDLVTTLANGTNVKIYEQTTVNGVGWARIDQGWVCMDYVKLGTLANVPGGGNNGNSGTVAIITTVPSGAIAVGYANEDIKIRSGSGLGYPEVGTVKKRNSVVIYENKLDGGMSWGRTDNGWVCTSYLTITGIGAAGSGSMGTVSCGGTANVRLTASSGGALMAKVMVSSRVVVRETTTVGAETWVRTDLGWINGQYVVMDETTSTTPDATTPDATTPTDATTDGSNGEFVG